MPAPIIASSINKPIAVLKANTFSQNKNKITDAAFLVRSIKINRKTIPPINAEIGFERSIVTKASRDQIWLLASVEKLIPSRENDAGTSKSYAKNNEA